MILVDFFDHFRACRAEHLPAIAGLRHKFLYRGEVACHFTDRPAFAEGRRHAFRPFTHMLLAISFYQVTKFGLHTIHWSATFYIICPHHSKKALT
ncbi:hypothetical protein D3C84_1061840 [compost metagenome]